MHTTPPAALGQPARRPPNPWVIFFLQAMLSLRTFLAECWALLPKLHRPSFRQAMTRLATIFAAGLVLTAVLAVIDWSALNTAAVLSSARRIPSPA